MQAWHSLFTRSSAEAVTALLRDHLAARGYTPFDPFGLIPGKSYPDAVRAFVAPSHGGWTRVLSESALPEPAALSVDAPMLALSLADDAEIAAYAGGQRVEVADAFAAYADPVVIRAALAAQMLPAQDEAVTDVAGVSLSDLPADAQVHIANVDPQQAEKLAAKFMGTLGGKIGASNFDAARALLGGVKWSSVGGARIVALMNALGIGDQRAPDFVTLRNGYQLHRRRERFPNATLLPGDAEALDAVPDALTYTPVYYGHDA